MNERAASSGKLKRTLGILLIFVMFLMLAASLVSYGYFGIQDMDSVSLFNVGYDITAMLLSIILFICCLLDGMQKSNGRRVFLMLIFLNFCAMVLDSGSFFQDGKPEFRDFQNLSMAVAFMLDFIVFYLVLVYLTTMLELRNEMGVKVLLVIFGIVTLGFAVSAIVNYWTPIYYVVDEAGLYHRTLFHDANTLFKLVVSAIIYILILAYSRRLRMTQMLAAAGYSFALDVLIFCDMFISRFDIDYSVILLLLLIMYLILNVQNGDRSAVKQMELETARNIQSSMLPNLFPDYVDVPEFDIYAVTSPARDVGGDFYDFFMLDEKHFAFLIGDVSSGGVGGALFMAVCKSLINMRSQMGGTPSEVLKEVNNRIARSDYHFVRARVWLGFLNIENGRMIYSHAGISKQAVKEKESTAFRYQEYEATPSIGAEPDTEYTDGEMTLLPGERIFLFTEGIPLSKDRNGRVFGYERVIRVLDDNQHISNKELCAQMQQEVDLFVGVEEQAHDITMLGFTYKGGKSVLNEAVA